MIILQLYYEIEGMSSELNFQAIVLSGEVEIQQIYSWEVKVDVDDEIASYINWCKSLQGFVNLQGFVKVVFWTS